MEAGASDSAADQRFADLVFKGGGAKGIGLAGAYRELSDSGYEPGRVAGTSTGAIMAPLVTAGYSGAELQEIVLDDFDVSPPQAQALFDAGRATAQSFLATWDFEAYIAKFRSGLAVTRRDSVLAKP
jgi:hypothetical protein